MATRGSGFSLIELVIAIAIAGILLSLGLPALSAYSNNIKLRAAAESLMSGLQLARAEAVRLNTRVELILTNAPPIADDGSLDDYPVLNEEALDNLGNMIQTGKQAANFPTAQASAAATQSHNWLVRTLPAGGGACGTNPGPDPAQQVKACWFLAGKRGAEGSGSSSDSDSRILIEGPASVAFAPLGGASAAVAFNLSLPSGGACAPEGPVRCLRVQVELGGRVKLCDPAATDPGDTRGCT